MITWEEQGEGVEGGGGGSVPSRSLPADLAAALVPTSVLFGCRAPLRTCTPVQKENKDIIKVSERATLGSVAAAQFMIYFVHTKYQALVPMNTATTFSTKKKHKHKNTAQEAIYTELPLWKCRRE